MYVPLCDLCVHKLKRHRLFIWPAVLLLPPGSRPVKDGPRMESKRTTKIGQRERGPLAIA